MRQFAKKSVMLAVVAALLAIVAASSAYSMVLQGGGPPPAAPWSIDDEAIDEIYSNGTQNDKEITVRNDGPDSSITVVIRNSNGQIIEEQEIEDDDSWTATVPTGGSCDVGDKKDGDNNGAEGEYWFP